MTKAKRRRLDRSINQRRLFVSSPWRRRLQRTLLCCVCARETSRSRSRTSWQTPRMVPRPASGKRKEQKSRKNSTPPHHHADTGTASACHCHLHRPLPRPSHPISSAKSMSLLDPALLQAQRLPPKDGGLLSTPLPAGNTISPVLSYLPSPFLRPSVWRLSPRDRPSLRSTLTSGAYTIYMSSSETEIAWTALQGH
jgi:hypothetical protein